MNEFDLKPSQRIRPRMIGVLNSTMIGAIGYDIPTRTLRVRFKNTPVGVAYDYRYVPMEVFVSILSASSVGVAVHANLLREKKYGEAIKVKIPIRRSHKQKISTEV